MKIQMLRSWAGWSNNEIYDVGLGVGQILVRDGHAKIVAEEAEVASSERSAAEKSIEDVKNVANKRASIGSKKSTKD